MGFMEFYKNNNHNNNHISNFLFETAKLKNDKKKLINKVQDGFIGNFFNANIIEGNTNKAECNANNNNEWPCNYKEKLKQKLIDLYQIDNERKYTNLFNEGNNTTTINLLDSELTTIQASLKKLRSKKGEINSNIDKQRGENLDNILDKIKPKQDKLNELKKYIKKMERYDTIKKKVNMNDTEHIYDKDLHLKRNKDETLLMLSSEKIKFAVWGILAFVLGIATIINFKKKID
tara:strand:+ start:63 stop:761 length:699 start_codon:yes stop_codon:yes gene_type:complete